MGRRSKKVGIIYLLCFSKRYKHARHYIGFCESDLEGRLEQHRTGRGARLMEVILSAGIKFKLARTWDGDRHFERRLKRQKNSARLCPICKQRLEAKRQRQQMAAAA